MRHPIAGCNAASGMKVIWATCREIFSILQADDIGCPLITVPPDFALFLHHHRARRRLELCDAG